MIVLAFDTATADTVVALQQPGRATTSAAHRPAEGERPGHATRLLALAGGLLDEAGLAWRAVERIGVGVGPGTFTGLRIGVATARALGQATGAEVVGVRTPATLAAAAVADDGRPVLGCVDARRGELYVAAHDADGDLLGGPRVVAPEALGELLGRRAGPWYAVGDGAVRYRVALEAAGAEVPADDDPAHHVDGACLCRLAAAAAPVAREALAPDYIRAPDAVPTHLR